MTRNTDDNEFQSLPIWALKPSERRQKKALKHWKWIRHSVAIITAADLITAPTPRVSLLAGLRTGTGSFTRPGEQQLLFQGDVIIPGDPQGAAGLNRSPAHLQRARTHAPTPLQLSPRSPPLQSHLPSLYPPKLQPLECWQPCRKALLAPEVARGPHGPSRPAHLD